MADNVKIVQCMATAKLETLLTADDGTTYTIHQMDMGSGPDLVEQDQVQLVYAESSHDGGTSSANRQQQSSDSVMPKDAILLLISLMPEFMARKAATRGMKMKEVWDSITKELELHGYVYPVNQIRNKWKTLERAYKKLMLPRKNGRCRTTCAFQSELDVVYAKNPSVMPSMMVGPCDDQQSEDQSEDEGTTDFVYEEPIWSTPNDAPETSTPKFKTRSAVRSGPVPRVMNKPPNGADVPMKFNSKGRKRKAETAISELVALRRQMADNFAKKREESQQRHNEKMALLRELFGK